MQSKVRPAIRPRPEACRVALRLPSCIPMQSQAQSCPDKKKFLSVSKRSALVVLCLASQVCSMTSEAISVAAKTSRKR